MNMMFLWQKDSKSGKVN